MQWIGTIRPDFIFWELVVMGAVVFLVMSARVVLAYLKQHEKNS